MPEGPFGNIEVRGPLKINEILLHGVINKRLTPDEEQDIIEKLDEAGETITISRENTFVRYFESERIDNSTVLITNIGDEIKIDKVENLTQVLRDKNFGFISLSLGDPQDRMEEIIQRMRQY